MSHQDDSGQRDVLEEAAVRRTPVVLEFADGQRFTARVVDVEATADGDVVVLDDGGGSR